MVDILHRVGIADTAPEAVHEALTTIDGLAGWWTTDTTGDPTPGGTIAFRFPPGGFDMKVLSSQPGEEITWEVVDGRTTVLFAHRGWAEPVEFMHHCSTKWATFLLSLKSLLETGKGAPSPHDIHIAYPD